MVVEAAVLGGDHRLRQIGRQPVEPDIAAAKPALGKHGAVGGEDGEVRRAVVEGEEGWVRQARHEVEEASAEHERHPSAGDDQCAENSVPQGAIGALSCRRLASLARALALAAAEMWLDALFRLCRRLWLPPRWHRSLAPMTSGDRGGEPTNHGAQRLSVPD